MVRLPYFEHLFEVLVGGPMFPRIELTLGGLASIVREIEGAAKPAELGFAGANLEEPSLDLARFVEIRPLPLMYQVSSSSNSLQFRVRKVGKNEFFPTFNPPSCKCCET